jgi:hypothetical protein
LRRRVRRHRSSSRRTSAKSEPYGSCLDFIFATIVRGKAWSFYIFKETLISHLISHFVRFRYFRLTRGPKESPDPREIGDRPTDPAHGLRVGSSAGLRTARKM